MEEQQPQKSYWKTYYENNKELVKEFKQMLVRFSNDGRIRKVEAREILLDLAALGY